MKRHVWLGLEGEEVAWLFVDPNCVLLQGSYLLISHPTAARHREFGSQFPFPHNYAPVPLCATAGYFFQTPSFIFLY